MTYCLLNFSCVLSFCVVEDDGVQVRLPLSLANHSVAAAQAAATQAATIAQVAALEQLRNKLESGEPPEKKIALPMEDHQRLLQRALQHNLLAMTAQIPMNIRINNQGIDTLTFWPTDGPNMAIVGLCSHILKPTRLYFSVVVVSSPSGYLESIRRRWSNFFVLGGHLF